MVKPKTRDERLFAAAVLRRSFELDHAESGPDYRQIYAGVLRDLELEDEEVRAHLEAHRGEVEEAVGPGPRSRS